MNFEYQLNNKGHIKVVNKSTSPAKKPPSPVKKKTPEKNNLHLYKGKLILNRYFARKRGNVYVNKNPEYGLTKPVLVWSSITTKTGSPVKLEDCAKILNVTGKYGTPSVEGYQSIGRRPYYRQTWATGPVGKINSTVSFVKINLVMLNPDQSASVLIFKSGNVQIKTNGQWERVARLIGKEYLPGNTLKLIQNASKPNRVCRFYCNKHIFINDIAKFIANTKSNLGFRLSIPDLAVFENRKVKNPAWLYGQVPPPVSINTIARVKSKIGIDFPSSKVRLNLFENGTILGWGEPSDCVSAFKALASSMSLRQVDMFGIGTRSSPEKPWNSEKRKQAMMNKRNPLAGGWTAKKNGHYVRPGPNGQPRFYPIPANTKLVRPKVIKAYANAKVNIPAHVKTALGITNTTVKNKSPSKKAPSGFNNQSLNGYYVEPNKQGKPKWYKLQKESGRARAKPGVIKAYQTHAINIPQHIKNLFKITNENLKENKGKFLTNRFRLSPGGTLRIDEKQLNRINKNTLLKYARNLNIPSITERNSKNEMKTAFIYRLKLKPTESPLTKAEEKLAKNLEKHMLKQQNKNKSNNK